MKLDAAGNARVDLLPQAGARRDASEPMTWYLEKDVNADFAAKDPKGSELRIMGGDGDFDRLEKRLSGVVGSAMFMQGRLQSARRTSTFERKEKVSGEP